MSRAIRDRARVSELDGRIKLLLERYPEVAQAKAKVVGVGQPRNKLAGLRAALTRAGDNKAKVAELEAEIAAFIANHPELQPARGT